MSSLELCFILILIQQCLLAASFLPSGLRSSKLVTRKKRSSVETSTDERQITDEILDAVQSRCTVNCTNVIDRTLDRISINNTYSSKKIGRNIIDRYDEKNLDQICQGYAVGSKCLKSCPDHELLKPYSMQIFAPLEFICISNKKDVQKNMPCIDKQSSSLDKACDSKCNSYSKSFNDLDKIDLTDLSNEKLTDMEKMFNDSCKFMTCQKDCEKSLILKSCSKEGADFTEKLYSSLFSMIGGFVNMINIVRDENSTIVITTNCFHND